MTPANQLLAPQPDLAAQARIDLTNEYVAVGNYGAADFIISNNLDDITERFGPEMYDRMLDDPEISARMELIKIATLGDGLTTSTAVRADDPRYKRAAELEQFLLFCFKRISFRQFAYEMLDALPYGHKVAEITYEVMKDGPYKDKTVIKSLHVKPRNACGLVCDQFLNVKGLLALRRAVVSRGVALGTGIGGYGIGSVTGFTPDVQAGPVGVGDDRFRLPRIKFALLTFRGRDNDPRGRSILRPCYNSYNFKQKLYPEWMLFACNHAQPSVIGIAAPDNTTVAQAAAAANEPAMNDRTGAQLTDTSGKRVFQTAVQRLGAVLGALRKRYAAAVPNGTTFEVLESKSDGSFYPKTIDACDRAITTAMLLATLGVREGQNMSRNAGSLHAGVVDMFIYFVKQLFLDMVVSDLVTPLIDLNEEADAFDLIPTFSLGDTERKDWAKEASAAAQLINTGELPTRVMQDIFLQLGFSPLDANELTQMIELRAAKVKAESQPPAPGKQPANNQQLKQAA